MDCYLPNLVENGMNTKCGLKWNDYQIWLRMGWLLNVSEMNGVVKNGTTANYKHGLE